MSILNQSFPKEEMGKQFVYSYCGYKSENKPNVALPQIDANNCGMCGKKCGAGEYCKDGTCETIDEQTHAVSYCGTRVPNKATIQSWLKLGQTIDNYRGATDFERYGMKLYEIAMKKDDLDVAVIQYGDRYNNNNNSTANINSASHTFFPTLAFDRNNCGQCGNKCDDEKRFCVYGKCLSYEEFYLY